MQPTGRCFSARGRRRSTARTAIHPSWNRFSKVNAVNTHATSLARLRSFALTPAQFFRLAAAEAFALWLIVGTGAAVRLTDSGLGCRHWPGCEKGHPLPAKDYHAFIEFGNRVLGGVTIAVVLLTALAAARTPALSSRARRLAYAVFAGTLAQAPLGY